MTGTTDVSADCPPVTSVLSIPSPERRRLGPRPAADPRLRAVHHPRHRRRDLAGRAALGGPRRPARRRRRTSRCGRCPFGLVGARLYHVATDSEPLLRRGRHAGRGALRLAGRARRSGARSRSAPSAPGIGCRGARASGCGRSPTRWRPASLLAQAIGRWGNWFNQELYGQPDRPALGPRDRPRAPACRLRRTSRRSTRRSSTSACGTSAVAGLLIWADRRFRLGHGRVFALYVMVYTAGRGWIEYLRIDDRPARRRPRPAVQRLDLDRPLRRSRRPTSSSCGRRHPGREARSTAPATPARAATPTTDDEADAEPTRPTEPDEPRTMPTTSDAVERARPDPDAVPRRRRRRLDPTTLGVRHGLRRPTPAATGGSCRVHAAVVT